MTELRDFLKKNKSVRFFNPRKYEPDFQISLKKGIVSLGSGLTSQLSARKYAAAECAYDPKRGQLVIRLVKQEEIDKAGGLKNTPFIVFNDQGQGVSFNVVNALLELGLLNDRAHQLTPEILDPVKAILSISLGTVDKKGRPKNNLKGKVERN